MYYLLTAALSLLAGGGGAIYFAYEAWAAQRALGDARAAAAEAEGRNTLLGAQLAASEANNKTLLGQLATAQQQSLDLENLYATADLHTAPGADSRSEFLRALADLRTSLAPAVGASAAPVPPHATPAPGPDGLLNPFVPGS